MTNDDLKAIKGELDKIHYQLTVLSRTIDSTQHPVESLILEKDWSEGELNKAYDIFEKWEGIIESGTSMSHHSFEADFKNALGVSYQGLKSVLLAFYQNGQWVSVCEAYVLSLGPMASSEYSLISQSLRDKGLKVANVDFVLSDPTPIIKALERDGYINDEQEAGLSKFAIKNNLSEIKSALKKEGYSGEIHNGASFYSTHGEVAWIFDALKIDYEQSRKMTDRWVEDHKGQDDSSNL